MTERITSSMVADQLLSTIDNDLNTLDTTEQQVSSGFQINEASDNPYGAALSLSLNTQISNYDSYQSNVTNSTAWTETQSDALQEILSEVQSVRTTVVEASNGALDQNDLNDASESVLAAIGAIKSSADAQDDDQYVFSGTATTVPPYEQDVSDTDAFNPAANTDANNQLIGPSTTVNITANLQSVLGNGDGSTTPGGDGQLLSTLRQINSDLQSGNQAGLTQDLSSLDTNLDSLLSLQAQVGSTQDQLQDASAQLQDFVTADQTQLGNTEDTNMASALVNFSTEQTSYQSALQASADIIQTSLLNYLQS
jgi:flagellar hook-associated protein 3 FlgL